MSARFGVHLGNSSICLALNKDGKTEVIANDLGDRVTPALLVINGSEFEICSSSKSITRKRATITDNKRTFDAIPKDEEIEASNSKNECKLVREENSISYEFQTESGLISLVPEQVATKFYSKMFSIAAHAACTDEELSAVIAVPLNWSKESRTRIGTAAELAGFSVLQVINEPVAGVLAYDIGENNQEEHVLVYRLGGTSCDVSVIHVAGGLYSVEAHSRHSNIGGKYITSDLASYIAKEFYQRWKLDPNENKRSMEKLFHFANDCKHALSTLNSSKIFIESLYEGVDWSQDISRARFENIISPRLDSFMAPVHKILENNYKSKITKILICGGSMKIPKLQNAISEIVPNAILLNSISPDEVIAFGCAKQAAMLLENSNLKNVNLDESSILMECIPKTIYAKYLDNVICLFPKGSSINAEVMIPLRRFNDSENITLKIYEENENQIEEYSFNSSSDNPKIHAILNNDKITINIL